MTSLRRGWLTLAATLAGSAGLLCSGAPIAQAGPLLPTQDPFYSYSGSLTGIPDGTVLRTRAITFTASNLTVPVSSSQVLYRTTDELGDPTVAVATVVEPLSGATGKILSYQWAYDGLASNCEPSYAIQGGTPTEGTNADEQDLMVPALAAGDTVVTSDYESEDDDFAAGREEGQITLDGIKATEQLLSLPEATDVALLGYSGGAIASDWAAELAPTYAPTIQLVGTAMGGIAVDLAHNLTYVNGSQEWSGAIPAALVGIARAFKINLSDYLSSYGLQVATAVGGSCLESDLGSYPGLTYEQLLKPQYTNIDQIPAFVTAVDALIMGTGGIPEEPLYMGVGDADGTGDDVMVDADDEALAHEYCNDGLPVQFTVYQGQDHGDAGLIFLPAGLQWAIGRLDGTPATSNCSSIPAGDSLAPLTLSSTPSTSTSAATAATLHLQLRSHSAKTVHLALRAVHAGIKGMEVELLNGAGHTLASKRVNAARGRLVVLTLTARAKLAPGTYRIVAKTGSKTLAKKTFKVTRKA